MPEIHNLDRHALRLERDREWRHDESGLHAVRDQSLFNLWETLEQARQKNLALIRELGYVVSDRARELARHRNVGYDDLPLRWRTVVIHHSGPVHV